MLRYSRSLVILALVLLLGACGETVATVGTSRSLGGEPTATATTAPPTATTAAPTATAAPAATATTAPTATVAPTATTAVAATVAPTATRPAATATTAPQRTPTIPAAGGTIVTDADKRCQMVLPAGVTEDSPGSGEFTIENDGGLALLQSIAGADLDTTVSLFVQSFTPVFTNYQETGRKSGAGAEQIDFTGELINPVRGTMYFKQIDNVICNVILVVYTSSNHPYDQTLGTMIGSLQLVKP